MLYKRPVVELVLLTLFFAGCSAAPGSAPIASTPVQADAQAQRRPIVTPAPSPAVSPTPAASAVPTPKGTSPGALDQTFGTGGIVTISNLNVGDGPYTVAVQSNGNILTLTNTNSGDGGDVALLRYKPNGALDTTFGSGGEVLTSFGSIPLASANDFAVDPSGRIIVVGTLATNIPNPPANPLLVARYTSSGALDSTFGSGGEVLLPGAASSVLVQANGDILVGGFEQVSSGIAHTVQLDTLLTRLTSNGSLDTTFGSEGTVLADLIGPVQNLALDSSGDIFANDGGPSIEFTSTGAQVASPSLSGSFAQTSIGSAFQPNGDVILLAQAGASKNRNEIQVSRITLSGTADPAFSSPAFQIEGQGTGQTSSLASAEAVETDGKIVVAGGVDLTNNLNTSSFGIARLGSTGALDTTFGIGGSVATPQRGNFGAVTVQSNGDIVAFGTSITSTSQVMVLARYLGP